MNINQKILTFFKEHRILMTRLFMLIIIIEFIFTNNTHKEESLLDLFWEVPGFLLIGICTFGRLWALMYICDNKTKNLIIEGPYSLTRNPLYFFSFLGALGVALSTEDWIILVTMIGFFVIYYPFVIMAEEQKLLETHGESFLNYKKTVPCFIPNFKLLKESEIISVNIIKYKKYYLDAMWFIWFYMILEIIEKIRECVGH